MWRTSTDQMGTCVELPSPPLRIISLVPSQTELLCDLGLDEEVVGITKFCVHPEHWRKTKAIIGGTKNFDFGLIERLKPDLIIGNKEENYPEGIEKLCEFAPVWMSDIPDFNHALQMIELVARLTGREIQGHSILEQISTAFQVILSRPPVRTLYLMWRNPWMGAAGNTFIHAMMDKAGLVNVLSQYERYPELSGEFIRELNPELVLLSTEPYPFTEKHSSVIRSIQPKAKVLMVDGEMFSWYGSRLRLAPAYFNSLNFQGQNP